MMTKEEARAALEAELFTLKLTKRMTLPERWAYCEGAHRRLVFQSRSDRLQELLEWAETWQSLWLPEELAPSEHVARAAAIARAAAGKKGSPAPRASWAAIVLRTVKGWRLGAGLALV